MQLFERRMIFSAWTGHANIAAIAAEFKRVMLAVSFPGVSEEDQVVIDPRNWKPVVIHGEQVWTFWDAGSGGKKTLFNVCYALAIHAVGLERDMPVPRLLIIDSPTKNISDDENPELVRSLYNQIYQLAEAQEGQRLQFLLIDSDLVEPEQELAGFSERRMAGEPDAPSLIPYYVGPQVRSLGCARALADRTRLLLNLMRTDGVCVCFFVEIRKNKSAED
jgi:hypothetical protein